MAYNKMNIITKEENSQATTAAFSSFTIVQTTVMNKTIRDGRPWFAMTQL